MLLEKAGRHAECDNMYRCRAPSSTVPVLAAQEKIYVFSNSYGFDGQVYHLPSAGSPADRRPR